MKKILVLLFLILIVSCKNESKETNNKTISKPKAIDKIKIVSPEKNLIYSLDNNTIVVNNDTIQVENPRIYSFDGLIENKKTQVHLLNSLETEFGDYQKIANVYIDGQDDVLTCYFKKNKNNKIEEATVSSYYSLRDNDEVVCKLQLFNYTNANMYLNCNYNGKIYKLNLSTTLPSYKCFDEISYSLYDCKKQNRENADVREYVPNRSYNFLAEIVSIDAKYDKIESELKFLTTDSVSVLNHVKWKHSFQVEKSKSDDDCYVSENSAIASPIFIDENVFVMSTYSYNYMGGAHGIMVTNYENYSVESGKIINLNDILNFSSNEFKAFYENKIKESFAEGLMNENDIPMSDKFFILPTGIVFSYAPYELMGFAAGEPHLFINYKDLTPFIANDSVLESYIK